MPIKKILILNRFRLIDSFCLFVYLFIFWHNGKKKRKSKQFRGQNSDVAKEWVALFFSLRLLGYERLVGFTLSCTAYTHNYKAVGTVNHKG
jgi:hypothetical protein